MSLSGASLSVCEDAHVVAVDGALHESLRLLEDLRLRRVRPEHRVKRVLVRLLLTVDRRRELIIRQHDLLLRFLSLQLRVTQRPDSAEQSDRALHVLQLVVQLLTLLLLLLELVLQHLIVTAHLSALLLELIGLFFEFEGVSNSGLELLDLELHLLAFLFLGLLQLLDPLLAPVNLLLLRLDLLRVLLLHLRDLLRVLLRGGSECTLLRLLQLLQVVLVLADLVLEEGDLVAEGLLQLLQLELLLYRRILRLLYQLSSVLLQRPRLLLLRLQLRHVLIIHFLLLMHLSCHLLHLLLQRARVTRYIILQLFHLLLARLQTQLQLVVLGYARLVLRRHR